MADIKIYGKLVSQTTDGILVGADQVYDSNQSAYQQALNAQLATALTTISNLQTRIAALEAGGGGTGSGSGTGGGIINLNSASRTPTYTLTSAIANLSSAPAYGTILMFLTSSGYWSLYHYTGTTYTDADSWTPMGIDLSTYSVNLASTGGSQDVDVSAADTTEWTTA